MADYNSLTYKQKVDYATDTYLKKYGITVPVTTAGSSAKIKASITQETQDIVTQKALLSVVAKEKGVSLDTLLSTPVQFSKIAPEIQTLLQTYAPPGSSFSTITWGEVISVQQGLISSLQNIQNNQTQLPPTGANVTYDATNTTPPVGTTLQNVTPTVPTNTAPKTTTNPSNSGPTTLDIVKAALLVEGSIALYGALNNTTTPTVTNPTPTPVPVNVTVEPISIPEPQQEIGLNSDPNTNIGNDSQEQLPQPQQTISAASDPNTNIGAEGQIAPQKVPDEFDGIDAQIAANKAQADLDAVDAAIGAGTPQGISTAVNNTRSTATRQDTANFQQKPDWRARLSLAPNSNYLYNVPKGQAGILAPLQATDGVIFPYTPGISVTYSAGYDPSDIVHSNYRVYQYKGSSVDTVSITADFTAQDTNEANYLLAVIHFFRSVTKMFYGQDQNPNNGVPPPLCYLSGFGAYTFDAHPLVVTNFTYATPTEVDYIRAGSQTNQPGVPVNQQGTVLNTGNASLIRIATTPGLAPKVPNFSTQNSLINSEATYVPTKLQLQITCIPIVTRNDISNKFSLKEYATGALLRGSRRSGGGIW